MTGLEELRPFLTHPEGCRCSDCRSRRLIRSNVQPAFNEKAVAAYAEPLARIDPDRE